MGGKFEVKAGQHQFLSGQQIEFGPLKQSPFAKDSSASS